MTREEIDRVCELFAHVGMIPVPITVWREQELAKIANVKIETKGGKTKIRPTDTTPKPLRKGKALKAARVEKGLRNNRQRAKG
jgi:hypothetical protein